MKTFRYFLRAKLEKDSWLCAWFFVPAKKTNKLTTQTQTFPATQQYTCTIPSEQRMDTRIERSWTLSELNTQSSIMRSYPLRPDQLRLPIMRTPTKQKMFSPLKGFCKSKLYQSLSHEVNGSFYRSASAGMLASSKPWVHGAKNDFTNGFDGSGMFRDTRIDSLLKERERSKLEQETKVRRAEQKEQFAASQLNMMEEKRQRRRDRRERKKMAFQRKADAATLIEGRYRIKAAKKYVQSKRDVRNGKLIARFQRLIKRNNECRSDKILLNQLKRKWRATQLQCFARQKFARKRRAIKQSIRDEQNQKLYEIYKNVRATDIQRVLRGRTGRARVMKIRKKKKKKGGRKKR